MAFEIKEDWLPMPLNMGPPLPRSMQIYWPWVKPPEVPPEAPIYACPYCDAEFATQAELYAHIREAHAGQPPQIIYMCPYCGARFDSLTELQEHMTIMHPPKAPPVYTCPHCGAQFSTEAELNYHIQVAHPPEAPPYEPPPEEPPPEEIPPPPELKAQFFMPAELQVRADGPYNGLYQVTFSARITNKGDAAGTYSLVWGSNYLGAEYEMESSRIITLAPGESHDWSWTYEEVFDYYRGYFTCWLFGSWEGDNEAKRVWR